MHKSYEGTTVYQIFQTESVGFEPTVPFGITGFQDQLLKPLGQLSEQCLFIITLIFKSVKHFLKLFLIFFLFLIFSSIKKKFCQYNVFWRSNFYILITTFYHTNFSISITHNNHGIICNTTVFLLNCFIISR